MKIAVQHHPQEGERRTILTPEGVKKLTALGCDIHVGQGIGAHAGFSMDAYESAGAHVHKDAKKLFDKSNVSLFLTPPTAQDIAYIPPHSILVGLLKAHQHLPMCKELAHARITAFALEMVPRITRAQSMDVLSSQSNLAGYRAVVEAAYRVNRVFPMMMTAAGTLAPARVLVIGAGVAGLQAIATAKRLGAITSAFDVRSAAKEQVESLGATFVHVDADESGDASGGYAKEMSASYQKAQREKLADVLKSQDIVIATAQIFMKKAPVILDDDLLSCMKSGAIIIDLASESGGNTSKTQHTDTITHDDVTIVGSAHILGDIAFDASQLLSRNVVHFIQHLKKHQEAAEAASEEDKTDSLHPFESDEILKGCLITHDGKSTHPIITDMLQAS